MTNHAYVVQYDTSRNSRSHKSYTVSIWPTDDPVGVPARGPVSNNILTNQGVCASYEDAIRAVAQLIAAPSFALVRTVRSGLDEPDSAYHLDRADRKTKIWETVDSIHGDHVVFRRSIKSGETISTELA